MSIFKSLTSKYFGGGSVSSKSEVYSQQNNPSTITLTSSKPPFLPANKILDLCTRIFNQFYSVQNNQNIIEYLIEFEKAYIENLDQFLKNVNKLPKPITSNQIIIKCNDYLKEFLNIHSQFYNLIVENQSNIETIIDLVNKLIVNIDVQISEFIDLQLKITCNINQFQEIFNPDFLVICDKWLNDWYLLPILRILCYNNFTQSLLNEPNLPSNLLNKLQGINFKLNSLRELIDNIDSKIDNYNQLRLLDYYLDKSNIRDFFTNLKYENPVLIVNYEHIELRKLVLREQFFDIDYTNQISSKSNRRQLELVLLSDCLLICQPIQVITKKGKKEDNWLSLCYPPFELDQLKLINYPDTKKGLKNLVELRIASKDLLILQANTSMSKCVWLQEFENLGLTQNPDDLSELNGLQTIKTSNFSTFININNSTYKTSRTHKRISRGMSEISIMTAFTKAIPPPIIMDNTEGILKIRRCHLWMWRHNIEDNLRWIGEGLVTVEIRITFDKKPFLIMYSEKSNIWDDTFGTISFSSWLVPSTDIERGGDSRVFLLKKYCLEPITVDDTNRLVEALNSAKQSCPDNSNLLTITSHLFSLAKVRVFYFREHNWEPIGHCMIEIRRTTSDRNSFALLLDMTRREIFNEWILDNTQVVRMNATNIRLAFTGAQGLTQFLIRAKESEIDKLASEMQREVAVGNHTPNSQDQIANFVSCYGPGREHETPQFEDVCKLYTIREDESSWLSLGLGIIQLNYIVKSQDNNPQLRMFCVATNTHELIFNEVLSSPLGVHQDMNQGVIVFEKDGVQQQVGVQFKTAQQASHFIETISRHLTTGDQMEVDEPPTVKVTCYESYTNDHSHSLASPAIENFAELKDDSPSRTRCETPLSQRMMDTSECEASDSESQEDAGSSAYSSSSPTTEEKIDSIPEEDTRYTSQLDDTPELRDTLNKSWRKATNSFSKANSSSGISKFNRHRTIKHVNEIFDFGPNN